MSAADRQRLKAVRRVAALREEMKRIEEIKLARLTAEEAELEEKRAVVIATLNDDTRLHGLFVDTMAARLRRVDERQSALQPLKAAQQRQVLGQARLAKYAETMIGRLARQVQAEDDRRDLEQLMEQVLARRRDASLPQACPAKVASVASGPSAATSTTGDDRQPNRATGPLFGVG